MIGTEPRVYPVLKEWQRFISYLNGWPFIWTLASNYSGRYYHNLSHVMYMLQMLEDMQNTVELKLTATERWELECAIWFHDVVYDVKRTDNEERSAQVAAAFLRNALPSDLALGAIDRVSCLINGTKSHNSNITYRTHDILMDLDMAILGDTYFYPEYRWGVYNEYTDAGFSHKTLVEGRKKFLESILARPRIYLTNFFHDKLEAQARINIQKELNGYVNE